jgi:HEAT repeat protein
MSLPDVAGDSAAGDSPAGNSPDQGRPAALPPVEAPTATFILQLFLIPAIIVTIVVLLWLSFSWLAHMGRDNPQELVQALKRGNDSSWQRAYELADLLRSPDPKYDALRGDAPLARELATFLQEDLKQPVQGAGGQVRVMRRMYLCRAIGSFTVPDGLPALMQAAQQENDPLEIEVRYSALEAIATLAHNCRALPERESLVKLLLDCSRATDDASAPPRVTEGGQPTAYRPHAELRAVAAYALGVVGGDEATARLKLMLRDTYANARYNAATGLARRGDAACVPVLKEMLDPDNNQAARDEGNARDQDRKRATVLMNGVRAALIFAESNPQADLTVLVQSLEALSKSPLPQIQTDRSKIQSAATEALRLMEKTRSPSAPR